MQQAGRPRPLPRRPGTADGPRPRRLTHRSGIVGAWTPVAQPIAPPSDDSGTADRPGGGPRVAARAGRRVGATPAGAASARVAGAVVRGARRHGARDPCRRDRPAAHPQYCRLRAYVPLRTVLFCRARGTEADDASAPGCRFCFLPPLCAALPQTSTTGRRRSWTKFCATAPSRSWTATTA